MDHSEIISSSEYIKIRFLSFFGITHVVFIKPKASLFLPSEDRPPVFFLSGKNVTCPVSLRYTSLHLHLWLGIGLFGQLGISTIVVDDILSYKVYVTEDSSLYLERARNRSHFCHLTLESGPRFFQARGQPTNNSQD
jgi:hypothetical protein